MGYNLDGLRAALRKNAKRSRKGRAPTVTRGLTGPQIRTARKAVKSAEASAAKAEAILLKGSKRKSSKRKTSHKKTSKRKTSRRPSSKRRTSRKKTSRKGGSKRKRGGSKRRGSRRGSKKRTSRKGGSKKRGSKKRTSRKRGSKRGGSRRGWSAAAATGRTIAYPLGGGLFHRQAMKYTVGGVGARGKLLPNFLASKGPGSSDLIQVVRRQKGGYPSYVSGYVAPSTIQRKFTLGGAAKRAHAAGPGWRNELRRLLSGPRKTSRKKSSRRGSKRASAPKKNSNRRHHMARKRRTRRNPLYAIMGSPKANRRRRRVRRNALMVYGKDFIKEVAVPGTVATGGFIAANALANAAATNDSIRNILDSGKTPEQALMTKTLVNVLGIGAAMAGAQWMRGNSLVSDNATAALTGMGLSAVARLLRGVSQISPYLGRFGEYVEQPMGEYVEQPMGAYVNDPQHGVGEYVEQPMGGLGATYYAAAGLGGPTMYATAGYAEGVDPANQDGIDNAMDVMEAAAGTPAMQAAAGMGSAYYALAGEPGMPPSLPQPAFVSQQTPTDMAKAVTTQMPYDRAVPQANFAAEGRGHAGGLFARNLFAGMF